jgi:hypothetical protein
MLVLGGVRVVLGRISCRVLRLLITYEALRIAGAIVVVYGILTGLLQIFVCVAVITAVVGLTAWVCNQ